MRELLIKQKQIAFFILAGALSAAAEIGSFKVFSVFLPQFFPGEYDFYGIHFPLSNIFSTGVGIFTNYFLSIWFVFQRGKHSKKREFAYFMGISVLSTFVSLACFQIFFRFFYLQYIDVGIFVFSREILSKVSAILLVSVLNYTVKKNVIFNG